MLDATRGTAYTGALARPVWFVQPSPMTHDPLFVARLLDHPAPVKAAVVYDFIPLDSPASYLAAPAARLRYHLALTWLARHELFLPISAASAARLADLLGVKPERIAVTGAPVAPCFEAPNLAVAADRTVGARHVLVVAGDDTRKNAVCAVRAHARSAALQAARRKLLVTGTAAEAQRAGLRQAAAAAGGQPDLLQFPDRLSDAALAVLYRDALVVVAPSRAEGFSLPVAEAMAAGVPAVASNIPAHRELVRQPDLLFAPDDDLALALILDRLATLPGYRAEAVAAQTLAWPRFRAAAVAARFWDAIAAQAARRAPLAAPSLPRASRPRVALLSPLPPDRSGCADYTAASCAALGRRVDLHLFTDTVAATAPIPGAASVQALTALPLVAARFDRVVGAIGNSPFHARVFDLLLRYGGAAIAHDTWLLAFYRAQLGEDRTLLVAETELGGQPTAADVARWLGGETAGQPTMLAELAAAAEPLCVHSEAAAQLIASRGLVRPSLLPFAVYRPWADAALTAAARQQARRRLGLADAAVVVASFGYINATKRPATAIAALALLRAAAPRAELHFVGAPEGDLAALRGQAAAAGLGEQVRFTAGYLTEATYRDYLLAADLGLQLRAGFPGSLSGALMDCAAAGLPTVANAGQAAAIAAPDYVIGVTDEAGPAAVAAALAALLDAGPRAGTEPARRDFVEARSMARYALRLCAALGLAAG